MSKRVIRFELSPEGFDKAIEEIERFKQDLINACNDLLRQLWLLGLNTAQAVLTATTDGWTGQLEESLELESGWNAETRTARIRTSVEYAAFVEFGTGIEGANSEQSGFPHPGYTPDGRGRGEAGWWYYNPNDSKVHWTQGEPAKPFMYTALATIRGSAGGFAATIFAKL